MIEAKNTDEAKKLVKKEIEKILKEKPDKLNFDTINERIQESLKINDISVREIMQKTILTRGSIIETAIHLENLINEIISQYYSAEKDIEFNNDFLIKTLSLAQKKYILNRIIKRENLKNKSIISSNFNRNIERFIQIRNIYAHSQEDVFDKDLQIQNKPQEFTKMIELNKEFFEKIQQLFKELSSLAKYIADKKLNKL